MSEPRIYSSGEYGLGFPKSIALSIKGFYNEEQNPQLWIRVYFYQSKCLLKK
jgi:hypothetical protein